LAPASVEKLTVSLAALRVLGPRFRFRTQVEGSGELIGHVWHGDLVLVGGGDPTLLPDDLAVLARDVAAWGIRRVTGRVLGDEHHFDTDRAGPGWKPSFLGIESAPLSALSVDGVREHGANGSAAAAARAFRAALHRRRIVVAGRTATGRAPDNALPLALTLSEPLALVVREMDQRSDNFVAEMLLKELGSTVAPRGSTAAGIRVVRSALTEAGIPLVGTRLADGSGLSRSDRLTVRTLVAILETGAWDPSIGPIFVRSLALAGVSGTLEHRLARRATYRRVRAKTGTTDRASALVGFVRDRYVFAILQNGSPVDYWAARLAQDRFATVLARS
jgi:D-alanyl-D-alanine carboxypeptidase/D-alanyl-D-alanine-endopeptidase (penicillin-binding protein 4)